MTIIDKILDVMVEITKGMVAIALAFAISMECYFDRVETQAAKAMIENPGVYSDLIDAECYVLNNYTYGTFIDEHVNSLRDTVFDIIGK